MGVGLGEMGIAASQPSCRPSKARELSGEICRENRYLGIGMVLMSWEVVMEYW